MEARRRIVVIFMSTTTARSRTETITTARRRAIPAIVYVRSRRTTPKPRSPRPEDNWLGPPRRRRWGEASTLTALRLGADEDELPCCCGFRCEAHHTCERPGRARALALRLYSSARHRATHSAVRGLLLRAPSSELRPSGKGGALITGCTLYVHPGDVLSANCRKA